MARPLRIQFAGALYHVTSRGNARAPIFLGDSDRYLFLDVLGLAIERHHWLCHAYCMMTNHYHLVLETPSPNLSRGMRQLNGLYTQRFNRRHERVGQIFPPQYALGRADRNERIRNAIRTGYSASEVGRYLGLHYSTVGKIVATQAVATPAAATAAAAENSQFQT